MQGSKRNYSEVILFVCVGNIGLAPAQATFTKVQIADRIRKVEAGVDHSEMRELARQTLR